jgi:hypothetical protein
MRNAFEGVGSDDVKPISLDYPRPDRLIIVRNSTQSGEFLTLPALEGYRVIASLGPQRGIEFAPVFSSYALRKTLRG